MAGKDGRDATRPYRARVGKVWYWVDPTVPADAIESGDTVIFYPLSGDATLATLQRRSSTEQASASIEFANLDGEHFNFATRDIAAMHLAAVDDDQS